MCIYIYVHIIPIYRNEYSVVSCLFDEGRFRQRSVKPYDFQGFRFGTDCSGAMTKLLIGFEGLAGPRGCL